MTTVSPGGNPTLNALVNNSGSDGIFTIRDDSTSDDLFLVYSDFRVELRGRLFRNQSDPPTFWNKSLTTNGTLARISGGQETLFFEVVDDGVQIRANSDLELEGDEVHLRHADDGYAYFVDASANVVGQWLINGPTGTSRMKMVWPSFADGTATLDPITGTDDADLALGSIAAGRNSRGVVELQKGTKGGSDAAAVLVFEDQDGVSWYVWIDNNDDVRIDDADPGTDDQPAGSLVVGP